MLQGLQSVEEQQGYLHVQLRKESDYDPYIYELIRMDEECLQPLQQTKRIFRYEIGGLLSLSCFLDNYIFEREEGYCFLIQLLERMIKVNRNKPIILDVRFIYLPPQGNFLRFLAVPLNVEHWYLQKEESRRFVQYLAMHFQTKESYEIIGFMIRCTHGDEFSLTSLLQGILLLKDLYAEKTTVWKRWFQKKQQQSFVARAAVLKDSAFVSNKARQNDVEETSVRDTGERTSVLGDQKEQACLESEGGTFLLKGAFVEIGRAEDCSIQLTDEGVSMHHLRLRCVQGRWYIKDLRSKNGTMLNGKHLQREMRLKEGMVIQLAQNRLIFHEKTTW